MIVSLETTVENLDLVIKTLKSVAGQFWSDHSLTANDAEELESIVKSLENQRNQYVVSRTFPGS